MKRKTLSPGTTLNTYLITGEAGQDAFGASYIVRFNSDGPQKKRFLIREFFPASLSVRRSGQVVPARKELTDSFTSAKAACADLFDRLDAARHESLVPALDRFEQNNTLFRVTAWPDGETLAEIVQNYGVLTAENARSLLEAMIPAMAALEAAGVVHGGVSPDAIFRRDDGVPVLNPPSFPCLAGGSLIVPAGKTMPTAYMPPEFFADPAETVLSATADVYALGATAVFLLTGVTPPLALDRRAALASSGTDLIDWDHVETACADDAALFAGLRAALEIEPQARPQGFAALNNLVFPPVSDGGKPLFDETSGSPDDPNGKLALLKLVMGVAAGLIMALGLFFIVPGYLPPKSWSSAGLEPIPVPDPSTALQLPDPSPTPVTVAVSVDDLPKVQPSEEDFLRADTAAWEAAVSGGDPAAYRVYIGAFGVTAPKPGRYAEEAELRLAELLKADITPQSDPVEDTSEKAPDPPPKPEETTLLPGQSFRDCDECPELIVLPAGSSQIGASASEPGAMPDEFPARTVTLEKMIAVSAYEITLAEYRHYLEQTGEQPADLCSVHSGDRPAYWTLQPGRNVNDPGYPVTSAHPAVCLSWTEANHYAQWLSLITGEVYRLPTEAEWEYAARGGQQSVWVWGSDPTGICTSANGADLSLDAATGQDWFTSDCRDGHSFAAPVGQSGTNGFGVSDMAGNVLEWVQDCRTSGYQGADASPKAASAGDCSFRGVRGGSWASSPDQLRSAKRHFVPAGVRYNTIGVRLVRELK